VSASSRYVPNRGDIVWLEFDPQAGHEQAGRRPAVVLSPQAYNDRTGLMVCCPVTSKVKGYPFEVALPPDFAITGVALTDQVGILTGLLAMLNLWQGYQRILFGTCCEWQRSC